MDKLNYISEFIKFSDDCVGLGVLNFVRLREYLIHYVTDRTKGKVQILTHVSINIKIVDVVIGCILEIGE